jgi:hypothetical protein
MSTTNTLAMKERDAALHEKALELQAENRLWLDEIEIWRKEHEAALSELAEFEQKCLHPFRMMLDTHAEELLEHERQMEAHQHALGQHIQGNDVLTYRSLIGAIRQTNEKHRAERKLHKEVKSKFASLMAHRAVVRRALGLPK